MRAFLFALLLPLNVLAEHPNILLICIDDLRPELHSLGAEYIHSPAMDSLVDSGRAFTCHYVQAPTCGASRYSLLKGRYATTSTQKNNGAFFCPEARKPGQAPSLPGHFRKHGYQTVAVGKISHHPGGRGGKDWNDPGQIELPGAWNANLMPTDPWKSPQGGMHGYAGGIPRGKYRPAREHKEGDDRTYTDGWITDEALRQMTNLAASDPPFFLAVGIMKPHLPFACPAKYYELYKDKTLPPVSHPGKPGGLSTWHGSGEFLRYQHGVKNPKEDAEYAVEMRKSYAACVSYADAQVKRLLDSLETLGIKENTIVILWGDHGWHLGEHAIWGKHALFEESLRSPLIIRAPGLTSPGTKSSAIVETTDVYPTLCELAKLPIPNGLDGSSLQAELADPKGKAGHAISYQASRETIRTSQYRLIRHRKKKSETAYELYNHKTDLGETTNIADANPKVVEELSAILDQKLK